jgi:hypothetical protein
MSQPHSSKNRHARLTNQYRERCGGDWLRLADDRRLRERLCRHLYGAGLFEELFALVAESDAWGKARFQHVTTLVICMTSTWPGAGPRVTSAGHSSAKYGAH